MFNDGMHYPFDLEVKKKEKKRKNLKNLLLSEGCAVGRQQTVPGAHTTQMPTVHSLLSACGSEARYFKS